MKAVVVEKYGAFNSALFKDLPDPVPGPNDVIVIVKVADVNFPDIMVIEGTYQIKPPLPFSPGKAAAGVVEQVGESVNGLKPGDRVLACVEYGAYAEKLVARADQCHLIPDEISYSKAAAMGLVYLTAYFALTDRAYLQPGDTVLVLGAKGGIGVASMQLAKALGAATVIAGVRGSEHVRNAEGLGADYGVDLSTDNIRNSLREAVHSVTGGKGVDVVIDPVGGEACEAALRALAWRGRLVVVGFASGDFPQIRANYLLVKNISATGLQVSDYRDRLPERTAAAQAALFGFYLKGLIDPHVSKVVPLDRYSEALDAIRMGHVIGKVILDVGNEH